MSVLKTLFHQDSGCLNPYSIGRYSMREIALFCKNLFSCLNPYSIGRYSMSQSTIRRWYRLLPSLNPYSIGRYSMSVEVIYVNAALIWS